MKGSPDGKEKSIERSAIYHISEHNYAYAVDEKSLKIRLKTKRDNVDEVFIYFKNLYDHTEAINRKAMDKILSDGISDLYETTISVEQKRFKYYFELIYPGGNIFYTSDGFMSEVTEINCFFYPYINEADISRLPSWAEGEILYQIFTDRFYDGNPANNPDETRAFDELPDKDTYYGGDFEGIIDRLDYVAGLGVKMIYLNPVFLSFSYHKYDTVDYYQIDSGFGNASDLIRLSDEIHRRNMKLILDGVFNHCSSSNPIFKDVLTNQSNSKYRDWFCISDFPIDEILGNYDSFGGLVPGMPRLNTDNSEVIRYVIDVAIYWTRLLHLDGWRLDVADEVSHDLWIQFRRELKSLFPDILLLGEIWNHSSRWLQGNELDTATNYKFMRAIHDFAQGRINSRTFWNRINANKMLYKSQLYNYLVNLVGSHDTIRCRTLLNSVDLHVLVMAVNMAFEGIPLIYYGDELCMEGGFDPDNRRAMRWQDLDTECAKVLRELSRFRAESEVLKKGSLIPVYPEEDRVIAFCREYAGEGIYFIANFNEKSVELRNRYGIGSLIHGEAMIEDERIQVKGKKFAIFHRKHKTDQQ